VFTAISAVIGFLASIVPQVFKFFQTKEDNRHELAILDKQIEMQKLTGAQRLQEIGVQADVSESEALYRAAEPKITGVLWVDAVLQAMNALMRPVVVYCYFFEYMLIKYATYLILTQGNMPWKDAILALWTDFDQSMLAGVMGFLFGNRSMQHWFGKK